MKLKKEDWKVWGQSGLQSEILSLKNKQTDRENMGLHVAQLGGYLPSTHGALHLVPTLAYPACAVDTSKP